MRIKCIAVGKSMPNWVYTATAEYQKRLQAGFPLEFIEIPAAKRSKTSNPRKNMEIEAQLIEKAKDPRDKLIITAVDGKLLSTESLAKHCENWQQSGQNLNLIIGGPDGIHPDLQAKADFSWSLSPLTLPHPIVRIVVAEQIYRAWSILMGHPYHRG